MNIRVRGIVINNDKLVLIKRVRNKDNKEITYYVFPGGGLESGETHEDGVKREVLEELGIDVSVLTMKYIDNFEGTYTYFYECDWISGDLGTGQGPEYTSEEYKSRGKYLPMAIPINELSDLNVVPKEVKDLIINEYNTRLEEEKCIKFR